MKTEEIAALGVVGYVLLDKAGGLIPKTPDFNFQFPSFDFASVGSIADTIDNIIRPDTTYATVYAANIPDWVTTPKWLNGMVGIPDPQWMRMVQAWYRNNPTVTVPKLW